MDDKVEKLIGRIRTPNIMKETTKAQLDTAIKMLNKEIGINESCNLRTEENDTELRKLLDARCRCRQRLSIMKE